MLPFFVLGTVCSSSTLHHLKNRKYFILRGCITLALIGWAVFQNTFNFNVLFWVDPYNIAGYTNQIGLAARIGAIVIALIIGLGLIAITPATKNRLSALGSRTIVIYIFHGFFVKPFFVRFPTWHSSLLTDVLIITFPFLLIVILSLPLFYTYYNRFIGIIARRIMK